MTLDISLIVVILNFILLMIIMNRLIFTPLKNYLTGRQTKIKEEMEAASLSIEKANQMIAEKEDEVKKTLDDTRALRETIRKDAEHNAEAIIHRAHEHERDIIQQAQDQIVELQKKALIDMETELSEIIAEVAGKVLAEKIDQQKDKDLIHRLLTNRG